MRWRGRIRDVQVDNIRDFLEIRSMDKVPNVREKRDVRSGEGSGRKDYEGVLRLFGHVERNKNDRIAKRV